MVISPFNNNESKRREEWTPRLDLDARENSEAEESLEGDPIEMCVYGLRTMLQVSSERGKATRGWQYGR